MKLVENTSPVDSGVPVKDSSKASQVAAPPFDPLAVVARFEVAAMRTGFDLEKMGEASGCPILALTKRSPGPRPRIYLSAGIHGDEPAPPLALLAMLEAGIFDARATWFLCPVLNPSGLLRATRENAGGIDMNRDYRDPQSAEVRAHIAWLQRQPNFDVTFCVHEDWEAKGYYLYEQNPLGRPSLAEPMLAAAAAAVPIDPSGLIDEREAVNGIIRPAVDPLTREKWPEAIYLRAHHTTLGYTVESPSAFPLAGRISAHRAALETGLMRMCGR